MLHCFPFSDWGCTSILRKSSYSQYYLTAGSYACSSLIRTSCHNIVGVIFVNAWFQLISNALELYQLVSRYYHVYSLTHNN